MKILKIRRPKGAIAVWRTVSRLIIANPVILVPFGILAVCETFTLYLLSCAPHFPVSIVLAPAVRSIWDEAYLHYPYNYEILPKMFYFAKIVLGIFIGSVTGGMAVTMVYLFTRKHKVDLRAVFFSVLKRYVSLFLLTAILYACVHFLMQQPPVLLLKYFRGGHPNLLFAGPKFWFNVFLPFLTFLMAALLHGLFVYSIPYVVIKGKKFLAALGLGIGLFFKIFLKTFIVIVIPMILYIPVSMLRDNLDFLANYFSPEIIVGVLFLGILTGTVIVTCLITAATTLLFIEATDEK